MLTKVSLLVAAAMTTIVLGASAGGRTLSPQLAQAQPAPAPQSQARPQQGPMTRDEFTKALDRRFTAIDTNKDGHLTGEEIAAAQALVLERTALAHQQRLEARFKQLDTSGDGQLSLDEFQALAPRVRAARAPEQMIAQLDTGRDGRISAEEYRAAAIANFDKADADNDGVVDPEELPASLRR